MAQFETIDPVRREQKCKQIEKAESKEGGFTRVRARQTKGERGRIKCDGDERKIQRKRGRKRRQA